MYNLMYYNKATKEEEFKTCFYEYDRAKIFKFMTLDIQSYGFIPAHYIVSEMNNYTRFQNGVLEYRLYKI